MREFEGNGSSSAPPIKAPELPERTHEQKQQDAIAETQRRLNFAYHQLEAVQRAHDLRGWETNYTRLQDEIASSTTALEKANELQVDAGTLTALQTRIITLSQAATAAKPPKQPELPLESEIYVALTAKPEGSAETGHQRKEMAIHAVFQQLDVANSRALLRRINQGLPDDRLAAAFHELTPSRQARLLQTLADASKREAMAAEPAGRAARAASREVVAGAPTRRAVWSADPETARGDVLHAGPSFPVRTAGTNPAPSQGFPAASEAPTTTTRESVPPEVKLRRILEAGESDEQVEAQLGSLFDELDDATRRALAQRLAHYRPGNGDDIAARFLRLDPRVRRHLLGALTAPVRQAAEPERSTPARRADQASRGVQLLTVTAPPSSASHPLLLPDADHPARRDIDGEQVIQIDKTTEPGKSSPIRYRSWNRSPRSPKPSMFRTTMAIPFTSRSRIASRAARPRWATSPTPGSTPSARPC